MSNPARLHHRRPHAAEAVESIKRQVSALKRISDELRDPETARAVYVHADLIADAVDLLALLALPECADEPVYLEAIRTPNDAVDLAVAFEGQMPAGRGA